MKKLVDRSKLIFEKDKIIITLEEKLVLLEKRLPEKVNDISDTLEEEESSPATVHIYKCTICSFETKHDKGLKIHKKRKHAHFETTKFLSVYVSVLDKFVPL
eukprot:TRINITY_DN21973_c0_g1_i1.p1 TRINITY_DN21973_c0_g1~~TRINITY_DN21973_c0_g1_i1.p1  ORF type:complete len:102 (+),score=17.44 TRINITY_DN21973_c0_g1_i1:160-465(+)